MLIKKGDLAMDGEW